MGLSRFQTVEDEWELKTHKCSLRFVQRHPRYPYILQFRCKKCNKFYQRDLWGNTRRLVWGK